MIEEFIKHQGDEDGWSEWVCPDPKSYLMKCCDCGLVHEAQFGVVRYEAGSAEDCGPVDDPNLQAVFRMRRSEQWTPEDMAHRPCGLPLTTPADKQGEQEPQKIEQTDQYGDAYGYTADQLAAAVLRERERCAKLCDEVDRGSQSQWPHRLATMIRGQK